MTAREQFEAAMQNLGASTERSRPADQMAGIDYQWDDTEFMWYGFKLGRAAALEEAAKECEKAKDHYDQVARYSIDSAEAAEECAERIRALKEAP